MQRLSELYPAILRDALDDPEVERIIMTLAWNHCVGEGIRQVSEPRAFHRGVLTVRVTGGEWQSTLKSMKPQIIETINRYLGSNLLKRIEIESN